MYRRYPVSVRKRYIAAILKLLYIHRVPKFRIYDGLGFSNYGDNREGMQPVVIHIICMIYMLYI